MKLWIIGLQGVGKTTIFQLLTHRKLATNPAHKVMCGANIDVPDTRLDFLSETLKSKKTTYAKIELIDLPGFTKTNLTSLQIADALIGVIPLFGKFNEPKKQWQELISELILRDKEICENTLKKIKTLQEKELLEKCNYKLSEGILLREIGINDVELKLLRGYGFLTLKPSVVILNTEDLNKEIDLDTNILKFNAKLEIEISELTEEDRKEYQKEFGITGSPIDRFVKFAFPALKVISFFTVVGDEARAWQIMEGMPIIKAAGKVHSDMEQGFIRADIIGFEDFKSAGSFKSAKEAGKIHTVKQDYIVKDGDIIEFKFKV